MRIQEVILNENTSGARNVLANKQLVSRIADHIRFDRTVPANIRRDRTKTDLDLATWFVNELDRIEAAGVHGVVSVRDGKNHMWIAKCYANGNDLWEDITGEYPETIRDFMLLKNRNLLDPNHKEITQYNGVKNLHRYLVTHYSDMLEDLRKDAVLNAIIKNKRSTLIVDNPDYKIWLLQNRGAACAFGKGATFCTASSTDPGNWERYSRAGAIFGMVPSEQRSYTGTDAFGKPQKELPEKFQFDAPSHQFKNPLDKQVSAEDIKERFPYLYTDLVAGLRAHKNEIENPKEETGIEKKVYDVDKEIEKLTTNLAQYWTDKKRPAKKETPAEEPPVPGETPPTPPAAQVMLCLTGNGFKIILIQRLNFL